MYRNTVTHAVTCFQYNDSVLLIPLKQYILHYQSPSRLTVSKENILPSTAKCWEKKQTPSNNEIEKIKKANREKPTTAITNIRPSEERWETGTEWICCCSLLGVTFQQHLSLAYQQLRSDGVNVVSINIHYQTTVPSRLWSPQGLAGHRTYLKLSGTKGFESNQAKWGCTTPIASERLIYWGRFCSTVKKYAFSGVVHFLTSRSHTNVDLSGVWPDFRVVSLKTTLQTH